jgi:hypothetical protein
MRFLKFVICYLLFGVCAYAQSDRFEITPRQGASRTLVTGATVYIVHHVTSDSLLLTEFSGARAGTYYRNAVEYGRYKIYVNGTLAKQNHPFGVDRTYTFIEAVDSDEDNIIEDANTVNGSAFVDSTITLAKFTTTAYNYIGSGGSVTNNPDDESIENTAPTELGVKRTWFDSKVDSAQDAQLGSDRDAVNINDIRDTTRIAYSEVPVIRAFTSSFDTLTGIDGTLTEYNVIFQNYIQSGTVTMNIIRDGSTITTQSIISSTGDYVNGTDSEAITSGQKVYITFTSDDIAGNLYDIKTYLKIVEDR